MVTKDLTRKAVQIAWDTDALEGDEVEVRCVNPNNLEDVSTTNGKNDGTHVITYPADYHGESQITVTGSDGGEDTGIIEV